MRNQWLLGLVLLLSASSTSQAGWPFFTENGVRRGTPEYYEMRASDPVGTRQRYAYGKLWPPRARPVGPHQTFIHKYHSSHYWPYPYQCEDREIMAQYMHAQTSNGWQQGTTLYEYHFDPVTHQLNSAGQKHLHWILTHAPEQHRQANVASALDPEASGKRLESVEQAVAAVLGTGSGVPVVLQVSDPTGRPAVEVENILKQHLENAPAPVINYVSAQSGGSGG